MRKLTAIITLYGLMAVTMLLPIDAIFEHDETVDHLSKCPFSGLVYGFICIAVFYIVLLEYILYRFNSWGSFFYHSFDLYPHFSPRAPPFTSC